MRKQGIVNTNLCQAGTDLKSATGPVVRVTVFSIIVLTLLLACSGGQNFSQFPGFTEHFSKYPPIDAGPDNDEIELLHQYKPRIFIANDQPGPIDFYRDYVAHGQLIVDGKKLEQTPTTMLLNQHRDNPDAQFIYRGDYKRPGTAVVYARIDREKTVHNEHEYAFTFLTYNLVFPVSGILQGLGKLQSVGLAIAGNLNDWHQLDHYVNVSVALLNSKPVAMTLQQHNYQTTYLLNTQSPEITVDIAMRSNELYPHSTSRQQHPAVSFFSTENIEFMVSGKNKPMFAGYDITHGEKEIEYQLLFLPQTDAFYQFKGTLGKNRLLPGRSGPPGADYTTLPGLMPRHIRLVTGYRTDSVKIETDLFDKLFDRENFAIRPQALEAYKDRFFKLLEK